MIKKVAVAFLVLVVILLVIQLNSITVYRFYSPGCGYCKSTKSEWNKFANRKILSPVRCKEINTTESSPLIIDMQQNFSVNGVPYIIAVKPCGRRYVYNGDRSADSLDAWISSL